MKWQHTTGVTMALMLGRALSFVPASLNASSAGLRRALCASSSLGCCSPGNCAIVNRAYDGSAASNMAVFQRGRGGRGAVRTTRAFRAGVPLMVSAGDVADVEYSLRKEDGSAYETPYDQGRVLIVVGGGGFTPPLHGAVLRMEPGEERELEVLRKGDFGKYAWPGGRLAIDHAPAEASVGMVYQLQSGSKVTVTEITEHSFTIVMLPENARPPLLMKVKVLVTYKVNDVLERVTFAGGSFWGLEADLQRAKGIVSTKTGYAQGHVQNPSYGDVCSGETGHAQVVQVLFDPEKTTFENLLRILFDRHAARETTTGRETTFVDGQENDNGPQYRTGVYYHNDEQRKVAERFFEEEKSSRGLREIAIELEEVREFNDAEEEHQQYFEKGGGQDARKDDKETLLRFLYAAARRVSEFE